MSTKLKEISPTSLITNAAVTYYTCPTNLTAKINSAWACNTSASPRTITAYLVPTNGTAGAANMVVNARAIAAGDSIPLPDICQSMVAGTTLQLLSDAGSAVSFRGTAVEIA